MFAALLRTSRVIAVVATTATTSVFLYDIAKCKCQGDEPRDEPSSEQVDWSTSVASRLPKGEYVRKLFDGDTLEGWEGHSGQHFNVIDHEIHGQSLGGFPNGAPRASTYLLTTTKHRHFRLLLEAKIKGQSNVHTGIAMLGERYQFKGEKHSYQGHLVMVQDGRRPEANGDGWGLFELMRRNWQTGSDSGNWCPSSSKGALGRGGQASQEIALKAAARSKHNEGWHRIEILVQNERIKIAINGIQLLDYVDPNPEVMQKGPIGLQLHWLSAGDVRDQTVCFKGLLICDCPCGEELVSVVEEEDGAGDGGGSGGSGGSVWEKGAEGLIRRDVEPSWVRAWREKNGM
jgi:hypothetical protein